MYEYDSSHSTFVSKATGKGYVETHHLIPMGLEEQFENGLDVTPNVVSLCPTCHSRLHYSTVEEKQGIVEHFYHQRKDALETAGIEYALNSRGCRRRTDDQGSDTDCHDSIATTRKSLV